MREYPALSNYMKGVNDLPNIVICQIETHIFNDRLASVVLVVHRATSRYKTIMDETDDVEEIADNLSHDELVELTESSVIALLNSDSLLQDLPDDITTEEIQSQVSLLYI